MSDPLTLFDLPDDRKPWQRSRLVDVPSEGWAHRKAADTEREAAKLIAPRTGTWRRRVFDAIKAAGERGLTDWELHEALGGNLYTVAPRRKELVESHLVRDSGVRRMTNNSRRAIVWVVTAEGRETA